MEERVSFLEYLARVFTTYGITMAIMMCLVFLFGKDAGEVSSLFGLENKGLPLEIMLQFLAVSFLIVGCRSFFGTDRWIKNLSVIWRTAFMLLATVCSIVVFIFLFDWLPTDLWQAWVMFGLSFVLAFGISVGIMALKTRSDNRKMEESLRKIREQWKEEENEK